MLLLATSAAAITLSLPPGQDPAPWAEAVARAGLTLVAADADVQLEVHGDGWWLLRRADPCTAYAWPVPATADARDAIVLAARVLAGDEPLPSFDEEAPAPSPPAEAPAPVCPDGPTVLAARATAPPDPPRAGPLVWSPPPFEPLPSVEVHPLPGDAPVESPPVPVGPRPTLAAGWHRWTGPRPAALVWRVGAHHTIAELAGPAGIRTGVSLRGGAEWTLGAEIEVELPYELETKDGLIVARQYAGLRGTWGRGLRVAVAAGTSLLELDEPHGFETVLWQPRLAVDGEVCAGGLVELCASLGVGSELFPIVLTSSGTAFATVSPLFLRAGLTVDVPVAPSPWRLP